MNPFTCCAAAAALLILPVVPQAAPVIAIDVGHYHDNPGAISARGVPEFEFNAALAKSIGETLTSQGTRVLPIGAEGNMVHLYARASAARAGGASFFLAVHHDSAQPQFLENWEWQGVTRRYSDRFSGFSLFVSRNNPKLEASRHCASRIGAALREQGLRPTPHHAEKIRGESKEWADRENGVYYYDNLVVLKMAAMPAVLLEAGVIINRNEEERLKTPEVRASIAKAVQRGLSDCGATR